MSTRRSILPLLAAILSAPAIDAFAPSILTTSRAQAIRLSLSTNDNESHNNSNDHSLLDVTTAATTTTRRRALRQTAQSLAALALSTTTSTPPAASLDLEIPNNPLQPRYSQSDSGIYKPAKRCTSYLVDSTIPPTLIPYRAQREAAILKNLGMGSGTPKSPFIEDDINLNNFMNKAVFGTFNAVSEVVGGGSAIGKKDQTFIFFGADFDDALTAQGDVDADGKLAVSLLGDICKPREREGNTAIGLAFAPQSCQGDLNAYLESSSGTAGSSSSERELLEALFAKGVDLELAKRHLPILQFAKSKRYPLLALAPEPSDLETVSKGGLQSLSPEKRENYVIDAQGFISLTQDPKFKLYTERSLLKDFVPKEGSNADAATLQQGNYFAQQILLHEACATTIAKWAISHPNSVVVTVAPTKDVRFMGGMNGRIPRICSFLTNGESLVDEESVTTILLNPGPKETLSESKFVRLEIGTAPENWAYQTKVADYLWFSSPPKVNMLPRMMNEQ